MMISDLQSKTETLFRVKLQHLCNGIYYLFLIVSINTLKIFGFTLVLVQASAQLKNGNP